MINLLIVTNILKQKYNIPYLRNYNILICNVDLFIKLNTTSCSNREWINTTGQWSDILSYYTLTSGVDILSYYTLTIVVLTYYLSLHTDQRCLPYDDRLPDYLRALRTSCCDWPISYENRQSATTMRTSWLYPYHGHSHHPDHFCLPTDCPISW